MIIGVPLCLFGRKLFNATLFLVGTLLTMAVLLMFFYTAILEDDTADWVGWVTVMSSILLGLLGGYLLYKC